MTSNYILQINETMCFIEWEHGTVITLYYSCKVHHPFKPTPIRPEVGAQALLTAIGTPHERPIGDVRATAPGAVAALITPPKIFTTIRTVCTSSSNILQM